ncbi:hypothetical protein [Polyangium jinanense]|uniref:PEGA domain-containing protein n=1 Tax=Polyangium jinanense TaxID=2829994 RepID=A0A9X4AW77_9BACT|nr:hypothetical protein [Polyangium jinanense]MDC3957062.1 hypothetical protein [Polyangium jinanense]MDC3987064.1 hypothetical protein [Polyangium jinanense]
MYTSKVLRRGFFGGVTATLLLSALASSPVAADEDPKTRAQKLFFEGLTDLQAGKKQAGCTKLRESLSLFATPNTLFNVARCDEDEGQIASALEYWQRGLSLIDAKDPRAKVAKGRIDALDARVPRLRVISPEGQAMSAISLDGKELGPSKLEAPLRVEPGKHVIVVRAPGREDRRYEVDLAEKERTEVVVELGPEVAPIDVPKSSPLTSSSAEVPPPPLPPPASGRRTAGFVVGGVGLAGIVAAGITGGMLVARDAQIRNDCDENGVCKKGSTGYELSQTSGPLLVGNAVAWGVGIAGIGAGLALVLTAPSGKAGEARGREAAIAPLAVQGGGGLCISGRF